MQGSTEVGIVIGINSCIETSCAPPNERIGTVVFNGDYNPVLHEQPGRPYQNFTVTVPSLSADTKTAQLAVVRFHLIGVSPGYINDYICLDPTMLLLFRRDHFRFWRLTACS